MEQDLDDVALSGGIAEVLHLASMWQLHYIPYMRCALNRFQNIVLFQ